MRRSAIAPCRAGSRARRAGDRDPVSFLPAVARRQPVEAGPRGLQHRRLGDFPFMVSGDSADVWSRQQDFRLATPRSALHRMRSRRRARTGFFRRIVGRRRRGGIQWLARARGRARSSTTAIASITRRLLQDLRSREQRGRVVRAAGRARSDLAGRAILNVLSARGRGSSPRTSASFHVRPRDTQAAPDPGYKVLRWEREWDADGQPFRDPRSYPACSVATTRHARTPSRPPNGGTRPPMDERKALVASIMTDLGSRSAAPQRHARDAICSLYASGSDIVCSRSRMLFGWKNGSTPRH